MINEALPRSNSVSQIVYWQNASLELTGDMLVPADELMVCLLRWITLCLNVSLIDF